MAITDDIHIRKEGRAGRITLTRPNALNALTYDMAMAIERALIDWRDDDEVALVVIDAEGDKAFCAGGDIQDLYDHGRAGDFGFGRRFWRDEYRLNALIAEYGKPYVALCQGFVMGGGVGIACHGSHRIVCETSRIAMPECGIGLIPDVGGTYLLSRAPGYSGEYLGLTGARMDAADAIHAGFADQFVAFVNWEDLKRLLCETGDVAVIERFAKPAGTSQLADRLDVIGRFFSGASALDCVHALEADDSEWARKTAAAIRKRLPAFARLRLRTGAHEPRGRHGPPGARPGTALHLALDVGWRVPRRHPRPGDRQGPQPAMAHRRGWRMSRRR